MTPADIKAALAAETRALGFDLCRVAPAGEPPHADEFRGWLRDGMHADMAWLQRNADRRTNPALVLPGARSVIVLGMNYWNREAETVAPPANPKSPRGRIARYAWGDDYHDVIEPKLWQLDSWLQ